jgi:hypothetical protein
MLCALTVRKLKPGTFESFSDAFRPDTGDAPAGWVRFNMVRDLADPDRVVTFGFFDGTLEEMGRSQDAEGYEQRRDAAGQYVDEVLVNGVFDIVLDYDARSGAAGQPGAPAA